MHGVSIIIPTLNEEEYLPKLLNSLRFLPKPNQRQQWEIIVADGGSQDKTRDVAHECAKNLNIPLVWVDCPKRGISAQRNYGASRAQYPNLLFLDADVVIHNSDEFNSFIRRSIDSGCAANIPHYVPIDGGLGAKILFWGFHWFHHMMRPIMPYALGATIFTPKHIFNQCGGFREDLTMNEDADYCTRAQAHGRMIVSCEQIGLSVRRLQQSGYFRMVMQYGLIFLWRTLFGDTSYNPFSYYAH